MGTNIVLSKTPRHRLFQNTFSMPNSQSHQSRNQRRRPSSKGRRPSSHGGASSRRSTHRRPSTSCCVDSPPSKPPFPAFIRRLSSASGLLSFGANAQARHSTVGQNSQESRRKYWLLARLFARSLAPLAPLTHWLAPDYSLCSFIHPSSRKN